jgi:hypothetical protein
MNNQPTQLEPERFIDTKLLTRFDPTDLWGASTRLHERATLQEKLDNIGQPPSHDSWRGQHGHLLHLPYATDVDDLGRLAEEASVLQPEVVESEPLGVLARCLIHVLHRLHDAEQANCRLREALREAADVAERK